MRSLFFGLIDEAALFPWPWPEPGPGDTGTLNAVQERLRHVADQEIDAVEIDRSATIPEATLQALKATGCFGTLVPREFGGLALGTSAHVRLLQEVATVDASLGLTLGAHHLGVRSLLLSGTERQKQRYLPSLASGERVAAFALAEASAGGAPSVLTRADRQDDGSYVLRGEKTWVTNGAIANLFVVFARTSPPDEGTKPKITAFLVDRGPGVVVGPEIAKVGVRGASTTHLVMDGVRVPADQVLGEPGRGSRLATEVATEGRLALAGRCVGTCKRAVRVAIERARDRRASGRPIAEFGLVKDRLATMVAETWALESAVYLTTGMVDSATLDTTIESAICKVIGSETCCAVTDRAAEITAAAGYVAGETSERLARDARANLVLESTNDTMRAFIALRGMEGPARERADVARAVREPIRGFGLLGDFALRKARTALRTEALTRHHPSLAAEADVFRRYVAELGRSVERVLRQHGDDVPEMQYVQKRTADVAIDLYALAATLSRTTRAIERRGAEGARREIDLTRIFVAMAERRLAANIDGLRRNEDELRKAAATKIVSDGGYPFDVV